MKANVAVVVADGSRARFLTLEAAGEPAVESGPHLQEREDLTNSEHRETGTEKFSTSRPGSNPGPGGGPGHGFDDHRAQHDLEHLKMFARDIASHAVALAQSHHATQLVLVADKHMLGLLREAVDIPVKSGITVRELGKDLTKLSPTQLHAHLAEAGLLPARRAPG